MNIQLHKTMIEHWLAHFKIPKSYEFVSKHIPVIKLSEDVIKDVKEISINNDQYYIDNHDRVFKNVSQYQHRKEMIGEYVGNVKNKTIYFLKMI